MTFVTFTSQNWPGIFLIQIDQLQFVFPIASYFYDPLSYTEYQGIGFVKKNILGAAGGRDVSWVLAIRSAGLETVNSPLKYR